MTKKFNPFTDVRPRPPYPEDGEDDVGLCRAAETVFAEAESIIYGDREQTYGAPGKNLGKIAEQWTLFLHQKYGPIAFDLTAEDVCWMMADLKKVRQMNSAKRDNVVDAIGYVGLIARLEE